jgi:hypothetical protein
MSEEIKNERDYAIRKGKILEKFQEGFFEKYMYNDIYRKVWESLIRDDDPYRIIEQLIEINAEQFRKIKELVELMPVQKIIKP